MQENEAQLNWLTKLEDELCKSELIHTVRKVKLSEIVFRLYMPMKKF